MSDYYQKHFQTYHQRTFSIDPSSFLEPLRKHLDPGCRILDIGCGSGRDMLWFRNLGFTVIAFNTQVSKVNAQDIWLAYVLEDGKRRTEPQCLR